MKRARITPILPRWYRKGLGTLLPREHRVQCGDCYGTGSYAVEEVLGACSPCMQGEGPCEGHKCKRCAGSGLVCARCAGMRFLRVPLAIGAEIVRCPVCWDEGRRAVDRARERREIADYLRRKGEHYA